VNIWRKSTEKAGKKRKKEKRKAIETDFKRKASKSERDGRTNKNSEQHRESKSDYWPVKC
jgi:hypothetical protein